jgi:hypothetical protein
MVTSYTTSADATFASLGSGASKGIEHVNSLLIVKHWVVMRPLAPNGGHGDHLFVGGVVFT